MRKILQKTQRTRSSRRYPGYIRIYHQEYKKALIRLLREDAADLIEMMGLSPTLADLEHRIDDWNDGSAAARLTQGILAEIGAKSPMAIPSQEFDAGAEKYYRHSLRKKHMAEAFDRLLSDARRLDTASIGDGGLFRQALKQVTGNLTAARFLEIQKPAVMHGRASARELRNIICLLILIIHGGAIRGRDGYLRQQSMQNGTGADP
jgi:hypothetical protein